MSGVGGRIRSRTKRGGGGEGGVGGAEMDLAQFAERSLSLRIEFAAWQLIAFITGQPYQGFVNPYPLSNPTTIIQPILKDQNS